jgi:SpoVK/Ycf46/Vps4 family AAA+-type ATPase
MMPLRRKLASTGFNIADIAGMHDEIAVPLTMADFKEALKNIQKSVSQDQLTAYADWMKNFGSV